MKLQKVLPVYDESNAHTLEVVTSKGNFVTPNQIVNGNELNAMIKEGVSFGDFDQIQIRSKFDKKRIMQMKNDGGALHRTITDWGTRCSAFKYKSCIPVLEGTKELSDEDLSFLRSMQMDAGMDVIYFPSERVSSPRFAAKLDKFREDAARLAPELDVIPVLDLRDSHSIFKSKFNHLMDAGYPAVCLWYVGIVESRSKLFYIQSVARKLDMWTMLSNYAPQYSRQTPASTTHILPWYGLDSYAKATNDFPSYLLEEGTDVLPPRDPTTVRFFGKATLGILDQDTFRKDKESLSGCPCEGIHGSTMNDVLSNGGEAAARLSKIHTLFAGEAILEEMRTKIQERELEKFLKSKKYPNQAIVFGSLDDLLL